MKLSSRIVHVCLFALCAVTVTTHAQMQRPAPVVMARKGTTVMEAETRSYIGNVRPAETVNITAKVTGTLWKAAFREGAIVKKGDLLFEIEDTIYKLKLQAAEAGLKQVEAEYDYAVKEFNRNQQLIEKNIISDAEFAVYAKNRASLEAKIAEMKATIRLCENDLSYTKIYSPITGRIGELVVSVGNEIGPSTGKLATIVQFDPIKIRFSMSEADFYQNYKDGKLVNHTMVVRDAAGKELAGGIKIDFFDNQVDSATDTVMIQLLCPNADNAIVPGGFVKIDFTRKFDTPRLAIPTTAVMNEGKDLYVYVVGADNVIEKRMIVAGDQVGDLQVVLEGLTIDELVVTGGAHKTYPGGKVVLAQTQKTDTPAAENTDK
ncbi:MAG: efflux RND transporter periplasmic adaptor subunit [Victivallales bacterium]|nr:efflux RND transporter periplasmic adaptor subunit [Victivallales bacterium]